MNFIDYFTQGLRNTIKFKSRTNFSFKNEVIPLYPNTVIDTWYVGDFTSATYEIAVEYGTNDVERVTVVVGSRVGQASLTVYGRTNTGRDLVQFSTSTTTSSVSLIASPLYAADGVTPLVGVYVTWSATYAERQVQLKPPTAITTGNPSVYTIGESTNAGGELGILSNWNGTNPNDPLGQASVTSGAFLQVNDSGSITSSSLSTITSTNQQTLSAGFMFDTLTFQNTDGFITFNSSIASNTLTISCNAIPNLTISGLFISNITGGLSNNVTIGSIIPKAITVTALATTGRTTFSPANNNVVIRPTGLGGSVIINPTAVSNLNNVTIGATTPKTAKFTTLKLTQAPTASNQLVTLASITPRLLFGAI
jgi:hypothetical protein